MRQRIQLSEDGLDILTCEGVEVIAGKYVASAPPEGMVRSFANWVRHRNVMAAAPELADLVEELRGTGTFYFGSEVVPDHEAHAICERLAAIFDRPEVVALLRKIKS